MIDCIEAITQGQQIVIDNDQRGEGRYKVGTVTRVTRTRLTVNVNGKVRQFNRRNGVEIGYGDGWVCRPKIATKYQHRGPDVLLSVEEANELEQAAALKGQKLEVIRAIQRAKTDDCLRLSLEELQAIAEKLGVRND